LTDDVHAMVQMRLIVETKGTAENHWRDFLEFILDSVGRKASFRFTSARNG